MVPHVTSAGWLVVPYDGHDLSQVYLGVRELGDEDVTWRPAFLDYCEGTRVAQIRPPAGEVRRVDLFLRVDDRERSLGNHLLVEV